MARGRSSSVSEALPPRPEPPLRIAISDCLTGAAVRFDGGHKHSSLPHERFEGLFTLRGICPELGIGLGVPREAIHLVGDPAAPRARGVKDASLDVTDRLRDYAAAIAPTLHEVAGFIFMKNSPSCGLFRVKVYPRPGLAPISTGRGIFAEAITRLLPELPVEDSGRLFDAVLCENFVTRTFAYAHWQRLLAGGLTAARLIAFHSAYKYLLMAHSVAAYREAGRLLANLSGDLDAVAVRYVALLMAGLSNPATPGGHANVLQHLSGYVKSSLDSVTRRELADLIHAYRRGELPLLAPLTLLRHHLRRFPDAYALEQIYLAPHPPSAALRRPL
jgi:uncharacterized protein YbgA (DUF1722 family)/uncharacterized protein YbbK (DUF523 family)